MIKILKGDKNNMRTQKYMELNTHANKMQQVNPFRPKQ